MESGQGRSVLAVPDFRRLWLVGLAISIARWLEMLVIAVVVFEATGSAFLVAGMALLRLAPMGLFGALLGVVGERLPRRLGLLGVLAVQAVAMGLLALLAAAGTLAVWPVALACVIGGIGWATDNPFRRMMIGDVVGTARMAPAMALDVIASNASRAAGPALGGALLAVFGPAEAFGLASLLYLLAIAAAAGVRTGASRPARRGHPVLRETREGFALALRHRRLRGLLLVTVVFNLFAWPSASMVPVIGAAVLGLGPTGVGVLASMDGVGALLGAALIGLLARPGRHAAIYVGGAALYLAMMVGFALSPGPVLAALLLVMTGVGGAGFATMQATLVYVSAPPELRGRALGVLSTAIGSGLLGFLQIGLLAQWLGAPAAVILVSVQGLLALAATLPWWRPILSSPLDAPLTDS